MNLFWRLPVLLASGLVLAACNEPAVPPTGAVDTAYAEKNTQAGESVAGNSIDWFAGSVDEAFAAAKTGKQPLFLYWGAQWCPPCHELKATVFQQSDFIQASRQFVAVYLDGDDAGAQQLAERYGVIGYPTLVVFNSQGEELSRIPNGLDLQAYAGILQYALQDLQPVSELVAAIAQNTVQPNAQQCQLLAGHSWGQQQASIDGPTLATAFEQAWQQCPEKTPRQAAARAQLYVLYLSELQQQKTILPAAQRQAAVKQINHYLDQPTLLQSNLYLFLDAGERLTKYVGQQDPDAGAQLATRFDDVYAGVANDADRDLFTRIQALRGRIGLNIADQQTPREVLQPQVLAMRDTAQKMDRKNPRFHATINATGNMLRESGLLTQARDLLSDEIQHSSYAWYFMSELAHIESLLDNDDQAVHWLQQAYQQARGPATRFQWGVEYVTGLLQLQPENVAAIESALQQVLAGSKATNLRQRSRLRMERLDQALAEWAGAQDNRRAVQQQFQQWQAGA